MKDGYILGTGLYSHEIYYYDYIYILYRDIQWFMNSQDAASLFIRIFSEFGIFGLIIFLGFLIKIFVKSLKYNIDICFFAVLLLVEGMRIGHYSIVLIMLPITILILNNKFMNTNIEDKAVNLKEINYERKTN